MDENPLKIMKYVYTGEVNFGGSETILNSGAIGSKIVITAFDPVQKIGAMTYVMLPDACSGNNQLHANRYAANAINEVLSRLKKLGIRKENIETCFAGDANELQRETDTIGKDNLDSVENLLGEKQIEIKAKAIGAFERRPVLSILVRDAFSIQWGIQNKKYFGKLGIKNN